MLVKAAGVGGSEQARVENCRLSHAAHVARQHVAARLEPAGPAALRLLGDGVHPRGDRGCARLCLEIDMSASGFKAPARAACSTTLLL